MKPKVFFVFITTIIFTICVHAQELQQECKQIEQAQRNIIFQFIQNNANFNEKVVLYPFLETRTFRDFDILIAELVKLGFDSAELVPEETERYIFEDSCQNSSIICFDTIAKYEKMSATVLEALESNTRNITLNEVNIQITEDNIEQYSLSALINSIYLKQMCEFKKPIIASNGKYVILEYFFDCGWLCGKGEVLLLENKNGKWVRVKTLLKTES